MTFGAFEYRSDGRVNVDGNLSQDESCKAKALFDLVGLGEMGTSTDRRLRKRRQAWDQAVIARDRIDSDDSRILAVKIAVNIGFFSVWMAVFQDDSDMRQRLIGAFPGTRME